MEVNHPAGPGFVDGPLTPDNYKRGVYRPPPACFTVEMLGAAKKGGSYSYGMRIYPIATSDRSSLSSRGLDSIYEVWRRWDDCIWFQGNLELEYRRMARSKRQRLLRGKGVRKDGFYKQDQASSWESLPPGPDPSSVAQDIHQHVPMLTKKGTVFRASQATIEQRAAEFKAMIEGLLKDGVPALVEELRNDRIVTDFFGIWKRDIDLQEKEYRSHKTGSSVTHSIISAYLSPSSSDLHDLNSFSSASPSPRQPSPPRSSSRTTSLFKPRFRKVSVETSDNSPSRFTRPRASSTASSDFSSTQSEKSLDSPTGTDRPAIVVDESPVTFDHDPHRRSGSFVGERPSSALAVLPEDREVSVQDKSPSKPPLTRRRRKSSADETQRERSGGIYFSPTDSFIAPREAPPISNPPRLSVISDRTVRESWRTIDSASCMLEGLEMSMLSPPLDRPYRASRSSVATFMTDCSADAVIPRSPTSPSPSSRTHRGRISCPVSISENDVDLWPETGEEGMELSVDLDEFPLPHFDVRPISRRETSTFDLGSHGTLPTIVPPSPTESTTFSISTVSATSGKIAIKAAYRDNIILLRVDEEIPYEELRQRLYKKFIGQEGVPLSKRFQITVMQPQAFESKILTLKTRVRSGSVSSDPGTVKFQSISSQLDWEAVVATLEGSKLTLRIVDDNSSPS